jgi:hypothetical protein
VISSGGEPFFADEGTAGEALLIIMQEVYNSINELGW